MPPCCTEPDDVLAWLAPEANSTDEPMIEQPTAIADATLIRRTWLTRRECTSPTRTDCAYIHCFPVQSKSLVDMLCRRRCWSLLCMRSLDNCLQQCSPQWNQLAIPRRQPGSLQRSYLTGKGTPSLSLLAHVITACRLREATAQHGK